MHWLSVSLLWGFIGEATLKQFYISDFIGHDYRAELSDNLRNRDLWYFRVCSHAGSEQ